KPWMKTVVATPWREGGRVNPMGVNSRIVIAHRRYWSIALATGLVLAAGPARAQDSARTEAWRMVTPAQSSQVFARDGSLIGEVGREWRTNISLRSLPRYVAHAFIAVEDQRFYQHDGVDFIGVAGAIKDNLLGDRRGASTITQQLVGN